MCVYTLHRCDQHTTEVLDWFGCSSCSTWGSQSGHKFSQLTNNKLVQAELSLRYWNDNNNLFIWAPVPFFLSSKLSMLGVGFHSRKAASVELSVYLPLVPSSRGPFEKAGHEDQRAGHGLATLWNLFYLILLKNGNQHCGHSTSINHRYPWFYVLGTRFWNSKIW